MAQNGKGDSPRPLSIDKDTFYDNWDRIFSQDEMDTCAYSSLPAVHKYKEEENGSSTQESSENRTQEDWEQEAQESSQE